MGIILKSELSYADMISILEDLHKYIPVVTSTSKQLCWWRVKLKCTITDDELFRIVFGGDQLTAAKTRGAQRVRSNLDELEGVEPVSEDWHARGVLLRVCMHYSWWS